MNWDVFFGVLAAVCGLAFLFMLPATVVECFDPHGRPVRIATAAVLVALSGAVFLGLAV